METLQLPQNLEQVPNMNYILNSILLNITLTLIDGYSSATVSLEASLA